MCLVSNEFIHFMIKEMAKANKEVDEAREIGMSDDTEYIGYREGLYDSYYEVLGNLGFTEEQIEKMENDAALLV